MSKRILIATLTIEIDDVPGMVGAIAARIESAGSCGRHHFEFYDQLRIVEPMRLVADVKLGPLHDATTKEQVWP